MAARQATAGRAEWTLYWLLTRRPFEDDAWWRRWIALKEELRLRVPR